MNKVHFVTVKKMLHVKFDGTKRWLSPGRSLTLTTPNVMSFHLSVILTQHIRYIIKRKDQKLILSQSSSSESPWSSSARVGGTCDLNTSLQILCRSLTASLCSISFQTNVQFPFNEFKLANSTQPFHKEYISPVIVD